MRMTQKILYVCYAQKNSVACWTVGILYAIYSNPILQYCILFQLIRTRHVNAVREIRTLDGNKII